MDCERRRAGHGLGRVHVIPALKEKGGSESLPPWTRLVLGLVGHGVAGAHPELALVGVEPKEHRGDDDRDQERNDVELADSDLVEDLVDDLEDGVKNQSADPAHVSFGVKSRDHDAGPKRDSGDGSRYAGPRVEVEKGATNEAQP